MPPVPQLSKNRVVDDARAAGDSLPRREFIPEIGFAFSEFQGYADRMNSGDGIGIAQITS